MLQSDFTDYVTEDSNKHHIGCLTDYVSRLSAVSDTETALDLIAVVEGARSFW